MDLSPTYLGLRLAHPFIVGASPLTRTLDSVKRLEDGGAAALVLPSLFEEQITMERQGQIHHMDPLDTQFSAALADFPSADRFALRPDEYLEHLRRAKAAVKIPVIASLNGMTAESWLTFARNIEQAGADALELNIYQVVTDPDQGGMAIEAQIRDIVIDLKRSLTIPIAVKLAPFFTAFAHVAHALDQAGADGLVLFNRFFEPDFDIHAMATVPRLELSTNAELALRLQWTALLHGRIRASIAVTGGVVSPSDGIKALLAGADAVQMVSAILRHGPAYFIVMREGLAQWMASKQIATLADVRGRLSVAKGTDPAFFERGQYIRTLHSGPPPG